MSRSIASEQITVLKNHRHVKKVQILGNRLINILLVPSFKDKEFTEEYKIKLQLPFNYPEQPPIIKFLDQLDHQNVCPQTNLLSLPILQEDWCPYITLSCIVDAINTMITDSHGIGFVTSNILSSSNATHSRLSRFSNSKKLKSRKSSEAFIRSPAIIPKIKVNRVMSKISMVPSVYGEDDQDSINQNIQQKKNETSRLKRLKTIIQKAPSDCALSDDKTSAQSTYKIKENHCSIRPTLENICELSDQLHSRNASRLKDSSKTHNKLKDSDVRQFKSQKRPSLSPIQKFPAILENSINEKASPTFKKKYQIKFLENDLVAGGFQIPSMSRHFVDQPQQKKNQFGSMSKTIYFQKGQHKMKHINSVLRSFYQEFEQLQVRNKKTTSQTIKKQLTKKQEQLWQMIEQLEALSTELKKEMMMTVRKEINFQI